MFGNRWRALLSVAASFAPERINVGHYQLATPLHRNQHARIIRPLKSIDPLPMPRQIRRLKNLHRHRLPRRIPNQPRKPVRFRPTGRPQIAPNRSGGPSTLQPRKHPVIALPRRERPIHCQPMRCLRVDLSGALTLIPSFEEASQFQVIHTIIIRLCAKLAS